MRREARGVNRAVGFVVVRERKAHDFPNADAGALEGAVDPVYDAGGVCLVRRIKHGSLLDGAAQFAAARKFNRVADAAPKFLFWPGAAGREQGGKRGCGEKWYCVSHRFFTVDLSLRRNRIL